MSIMKMRVQAVSETPTRVKVGTRGFNIIIDEPEQMGGTNLGMTPVEGLLSTYSACISITFRAIAEQMNIKIDSLNIITTGLMDNDKFRGIETDQRVGLYDINLKVDVKTDADQATIDKILQMAEEKCPVTDNIKNETPVTISAKII
ncbi:MAG: OsmC family protein [Bacteroidales bacterium]